MAKTPMPQPTPKMELSVDLERIKLMAENLIRNESERIAKEVTSAQFKRPGYYQKDKGGPSYLQVKAVVEEKYASPEALELINVIIDQRWEDALRKATIEAVEREAAKAATKALKAAKNIPQYKSV